VVNVALYYICALVLTDVKHFSSVMYIIATYNSLHVLGHHFSGKTMYYTMFAFVFPTSQWPCIDFQSGDLIHICF